MQQACSAIQEPTVAPQIGSLIRKLRASRATQNSSSSGRRECSGSITHSEELLGSSHGLLFHCAASCMHPELPIPPSLCPWPQCKRDESGGGRVHDPCALDVWKRCGENWDEPATGETKFCSVDCFLTMQSGSDAKQ
jgi:hypothetical protein